MHARSLPPGTVIAGTWCVDEALGASDFAITYLGRALDSGLAIVVREHFGQDGLDGHRPAMLAAIDWGLALLPRRWPQSIAEWREELLREDRPRDRQSLSHAQMIRRSVHGWWSCASAGLRQWVWQIDRRSRDERS